MTRDGIALRFQVEKPSSGSLQERKAPPPITVEAAT